ncbi:hypothetical protein [Nonomuraea gerenzanensis]|uniref:Uncharacterized protein n=1 Tax=Nonomuraea gerenzanensis TaxID=93944 RepID=A0A1M4EQW0_9ACTN|nr:hypothetical protein [Nonomuraea gerenzanensis]UBU12648.1 hypothetical protein LCN96_51735 [Nonomuraea gerenzanensis]SBP01204.1 hypothetical protein BN4615_P10720 [Nonomuraea gerenzanensis]
MTDVSSPSTGPVAVRALAFLAHRWPTFAGLVAMALAVLDDQDGRSQGLVVFLAALIYLATAVVGRPGVVWILFGAAVVGVTVTRVLGADLWPVLVGGAVSVTVLSLVSDLPRRPRLAAMQIPLMLVFGAAALLALSLDPVLGAWLVAVALIGHAAQDVIVWRAGKVVARSLAEFCAVLDFTLGVAIIILLYV